jgi:CRP-like cAMP-binding protein
MPILDDTPLAEKVRYANGVLRSRPRDLEDTMAQLVHDDDPVIAASAIHFAAGQQLVSLASDIEYVTTHRAKQDTFVHEAAALATRGGSSGDGLPVVALVDRIRVTPVFAALSIDELFRVAEVGQETRYQAGREVCRAGQAAADVFFLLEGALEASGDNGASKELTAPAVVNVEEVLQGIPLRSTIRAIEPTIGFRVPAGAFLTMVSDNILMAQSLFRLLLLSASEQARRAMTAPDAGQSSTGRRFRQDPLLVGATAAQLIALRAFAFEVPLTPGKVLFDFGAPPATYQVLEGEVRLETPHQAPIMVPPRATFGVADTLAGGPSEWRAVATANGQALRLDRDDLFAVMADHVDLMQNLFRVTLRLRDEAVVQPEHPFLA